MADEICGIGNMTNSSIKIYSKISWWYTRGGMPLRKFSDILTIRSQC